MINRLRKLAIIAIIGSSMTCACSNESDKPVTDHTTESVTDSASDESTGNAPSAVSNDANLEEEAEPEVSDAVDTEPVDGSNGQGASASAAVEPMNDPAAQAANPGHSSAGQLPYDTRVMLGEERIPAPFIADLVSRNDLREVMGYQGELHETNLAGKPISPGYHAVRFAPEDDTFGFAVELWRLDESRDTTRLVRDISESWFSLGDPTPLDNAAIGASMGIRSLLIASPRTKFVLGLSCGENVCTREQLLAMGMIAKIRLETDDQ